MRPLIAGFVSWPASVSVEREDPDSMTPEMAAGVDVAPSVTVVALRTGIGTFSRRDCDS